MGNSKIKVQATINAKADKVWDYYTNPKHIIHWNFADPSWQCPSAVNDMRIGGTYKARMEAKDGSFSFDFEAIYTQLEIGESFTYSLEGRSVEVAFHTVGDQTSVVIIFDAEEENSLEMQKSGWQAILNNFKHYTEKN